MYTGPWEVVGAKNKKDKNGQKANNKLTKAEKKKFIDNAPKVEDFLPLDQVKTLYDNLDGNKENKKPLKEKDNKTKENEDKKKQQQKQQPQVEKKKEEPKEKPPKSIEEALNNIKSVDLQNLLVTNKVRFPDAPLVWLKALVADVNSKIPIEKDDAVFSGRPDGYPLNVVPKAIRVIVENSIEEAGPKNARLFFEYLLTAMTVEMVKGIPVVGYKIFLQLLAKYDHSITLNSIPKLISMRNSYQNRKPVCLSLLWSFNQAGRENFDTGLRVWHEVMAPLLETKSYSSYALKLLTDLIKYHSGDESLQLDNYLNIMEDIFSGKLCSSAALFNEGVITVTNLRMILFQNKSINHRKLFDTLISKITLKSPDYYRSEIIESLVCCLASDERCYSVWKSLFMKYLPVSSEMLMYIENKWDMLSGFLNKKVLKEMLSNLKLTTEKTKKGKSKDDKYLLVCSNTVEALNKKMSSKSNRRSGFPWKTGFVLFLVIACGIFSYEVNKYGSFQGNFLRDSGIANFVEKSWDLTRFYTNKGLEYVESASPEYYKLVVDTVSPYIKLTGDFFKVVKNVLYQAYENILNYINATKPFVSMTIEQYAPGLINSIKKSALKAVELVKIYSAFISEKIVEYFIQVSKWLKTNVFVDKLSPESLQGYANQVINTTQTLASQAYDWVYEKLQTLSKVK